MLSTQANKRRDKDVTKILVSGYNVELVDENRLNEFIVDFHGPKESPYEGVSFSPSTSAPSKRRFSFLVCVTTAGCVASEGHHSRPVPNQVALNWLHQQNLPPEH